MITKILCTVSSGIVLKFKNKNMSSSLRPKVIQLYKQLLYMCREYPGQNGPEKCRQKVREAFMKHADEKDPKKIKQLLAQGRYMAKELEALYALKKYRSLKKKYYDS